jgi:hypothetical protein
MKNKDWIVIYIVVAIMLIGMISLSVNCIRTDRQLKVTQLDLQLKEDALLDIQATLIEAQVNCDETNESLRIETERANELADNVESMAKELENAKTIIEALESEEYRVATTVTDKEIEMITKTVYAEARGLNAFEQSAVVWCILNRVDAGYGTIANVLTAPNAFAYNANTPIIAEIEALVKDVVARWKVEKICTGDVGRTLPSGYLWFHGDGKHNYFRNKYSGDYNTWDWSYNNPYS